MIAKIFVMLFLLILINHPLVGADARQAFHNAMEKLYQSYNREGDFRITTTMHLYPNHFIRQPFETEKSELIHKGALQYSSIQGKLETIYDGRLMVYVNHIRKVMILSIPQMNHKSQQQNRNSSSLGWLDTLTKYNVYEVDQKIPDNQTEIYTLTFTQGPYSKMVMTLNPQTYLLKHINIYYRYEQKIAKNHTAAPIHLEIIYTQATWGKVGNVNNVLHYIENTGNGYRARETYAAYKIIDKTKALIQK